MDAKTIALLEPWWTRMRETMESSLATDVTLLSATNKSLLDNCGKLLRPALALLVAGACGNLSEDSVKVAAASELLHNATLMHDDVADDSMQRRGRPTVMSLMGASSAVLLGDFWLARAVTNILNLGRRKDEVLHLFSKTLSDLSEGEMLQLEKSGSGDTCFEDYFRIIYCKTASLFEAAAVSSAVIASGERTVVDAVRQYSKALGMAFQIKDDILDYCGGQELGKPVGVDIKEGKITLPLLHALDGSPRAGEIRSYVKNIAEDGSKAEVIKDFVRERDGIGKAGESLSEYVAEAVGALSVFPDSPYRTALEELARYNEFRRK